MIGTYALSSGYYDAYYIRALKVRALIKQDFDDAFEKCDVILCPTSPDRRVQDRRKDRRSAADVPVRRLHRHLQHRGIAGHQHSLRFHQRRKTTPIGLQLLGPAFSEETLRIARMHEANTDWHCATFHSSTMKTILATILLLPAIVFGLEILACSNSAANCRRRVKFFLMRMHRRDCLGSRWNCRASKTADHATQITVLKPGKNTWDVQLISPPSQNAVHKGDVIVFAVDVRCIEAKQETGEGEFNGSLQMSHSPWMQTASFETAVGKEWKTIYAFAICDGDFAAGDLELALHLARIAQTLEIGGISAIDVGPNVDIRKLPFTPITYAGREKDAPWRKKAAEQIEKYRKGDLTVIVEDKFGKPISCASVSVNMTQHAYSFGSFLEDPVLKNSKDGELYRSWFQKLFNKATTPLYWADWGWASRTGRERFLQMATWLHDHHIPTRGHNLVWPSWHNSPTSLRQFENKPDQLRNNSRSRSRGERSDEAV